MVHLKKIKMKGSTEFERREEGRSKGARAGSCHCTYQCNQQWKPRMCFHVRPHIFHLQNEGAGAAYIVRREKK